MSINDYVDKAHANAISKGWHEEKRTFGELIALCHCELSEAMEEYRNGRATAEVYYNSDNPQKPEGIAVELADVVIRIFDIFGLYRLDLEKVIDLKMEYNKTRSHKHGGKKI